MSGSIGADDPYNVAFMTPSLPVTAVVSNLLQARLDSIAIAEVLLQCEEQFGVDALALLQEQPLTLRCLARHVERATAK